MALGDQALNIVINARDLTGRALTRLRNRLRDTGTAATQASSGLATMAKRVIALASAAVGLTTLTRAMAGMLRTGDKFERLGVTMTALMGSLEEGEKATEWIKQFAKDTPLQVTQVTDAFVRLKGFGIDPMDGALQAMVDQNAKLGKGAENLTGITLALGQAWAKQKLQGEEIMQLVERGVPVWDLLAQTTGKTVAELNKMSSAGALGRDAIQGLIQAMGQGATGAAQANMSLLSGYLSNLADEWTNFQNEVAKAGALDFAKDTLRELLDTVKEMKADGSLAALARGWSDSFVAVATAIRNTASALYGMREGLLLAAKAWAGLKLASWAGSLRGVVAGFASMQAGAGRAAVAVAGFAKVLRGVIWIAIAEGLFHVASAINAVRLAGIENDKAGAKLAATYSRLNQAAAERGRALGLEIASLAQWKAAIRDGVVSLDQQTGAYALNRQQAETMGYQLTASAAAMSTLKQSAETLSAPFQALKAAFAEAQKAGKSLDESLAELATQAAAGGSDGIQALALQLRELEQQGVATKDELINGLGAALAEMSTEDRARFTADLTQGLKDVEAAGADTVVRLEYMQTLLQANLVSAAKAAGVSMTEALTGVDDATAAAVERLDELVQAMRAAAVHGEDASKIMAAGFEQVIDTLDNQEEVDAFTERLQVMADEGGISAADLATALEQVRAKTVELASSAEASGEAVKGAMDEAGAAAEGAAQVGNAAAGIGAAMAGIYEGVHAEIEGLSEASVSAFENMQQFNRFETDKPVDEMNRLKDAVEDSNASIAKMIDVAIGDVVGVSTWMKNLRIDAENTKIAFYEQKIAFEGLMGAWEEGTITAEQFSNRAAAAGKSLDLLDQQDLSTLNRAISQAEQSMQRLNDTTRDTVEALRNELDQLQGNTGDVEKRQYAARKRDLERQLEDAQKVGNEEAASQAREALNLADEIHRAKLTDIDDEAKARAKAENDAQQRERARADTRRQAAAGSDTSATQGQGQADVASALQGSATRHTIELKLGGKTSSVTTDNPEALLELLADAGMRTS